MSVPTQELLPLTVREFEVMALVSGGLTDGEAARRLRIKERTVKNHVRAAFVKMGVRNRTELAVAAIALGWLDAEDLRAGRFGAERCCPTCGQAWPERHLAVAS